MKRWIVATCFVVLYLSVLGQIREVKSRASTYKSSKQLSNSVESFSTGYVRSDYSLIADLFGDLLFSGMFTPIFDSQRSQLRRAKNERWRVGAEFKLFGGLGINENTYFDSQVIRGNWGLFSTQLRRINVNDVSGGFTTLDWQMLQLNLINKKKVRWLAGAGFSHETEMDQTHFEWATELYVSLTDMIMPYVTYRVSGDGEPRREFSGIMEFRPFRNRSKELAFSAGYLFQRLYGIDFHFVSFGALFYLK